MKSKIDITLTDLFVVGFVFFFLTHPQEWSYWYLFGILLWYRAHIIRRRFWHSVKTTAQMGAARRKMMKEAKQKLKV
jgi:hypothetical protein